MRNTNMIKRVLVAGPLLLALALTSSACDFLDPTAVNNPRTTDQDLAEAQDPTASLLPGLRAQFAQLVGAAVVLTEVISDNYSIHGTGLNSAYDFPADIRPQTVNSTGGATGLYWNAQELRALADFLIDDIIPEDEGATAEQIGEAHYYRGMAFVYLADNMVGAPVEKDGAAVTPAALWGLATTDLQAAAGAGGMFGVAANAALARVHRAMGDAVNAAARAQDVLNADPAFLYEVGYDRNSIDNAPFAFLVSRALREMQPLPRLDFLDPKYLDFDAAIPVAKAEEMYLIRAEALMAQDDWLNGREQLALAIEAAQARGTTAFDDDDTRVDATFVIRPRDEEILVEATAGAPARAGLVLERPGVIDAAPVSATSLDADSIRLILPTAEDDLLHALYLARQEILFLEARRMSDLGIRLPIMLREIEANPGIALGDFGTEVQVPSYIPPSGELDAYSPISPYPPGTEASDDVEPDVLTVTVQHDMNAILVQNRASLSLFGS